MTLERSIAPPVEAWRHRGFTAPRGVTATTMITVYLVLLFAVPSNVTLGPLGSVGRPALLWGILLLVWWVLSRLQQRTVDARPVWQPIRFAYAALVVVALVAFAAAMLRGQPADQVSPAITALLRLMSWGGVLLVAMDGVRTYYEATRLVRWLVVVAALASVLGLAQSFTGSSLLEWVHSFPGVSVDLGGVDSRGDFTRASGTATHPLEFTASIVGVLPLAIATAIAGGYRAATRRQALLWWTPAALIALVSMLAVSRSALIGLVVAVVASVPGLPKAYRWVIGVAGLCGSLIVIAAVPGLFGTVLSLFTNAAGDPSALSRTNALARVPEFIGASPLIGQGFGTFLPRYYIFDNQWVLIAIELGILGLVCFTALIVAAMWSAIRASRRSPYGETRTLARSIAASVATLAALFLFFDGLSFPISAGLFFLVMGLTAAIRTIGEADKALFDADTRLQGLLEKEPRGGAPAASGGAGRTTGQGRKVQDER
ncbi:MULTISPECIES: O-antigen ligase family protein [Microbacterium]|uniref:O-antigen ligase domain-containing protein n=1 Tax=Microbacterium wangchenii TaxID=2541726 RepID=A0ABX5SR90_9MICO|nr:MULTISPECIES: O-antigen ligase family protein [Microbacterium]MCK6068068.1 O-antigen ligase family protein [Microbacterium sp. EYE_512]QBR87805.1 O-antigen ligase domain-containing protein [Microbacterium wangchenii]TXK16098.1 O-antigen ligase family protein [Microbacterium wangchenii]